MGRGDDGRIGAAGRAWNADELSAADADNDAGECTEESSSPMAGTVAMPLELAPGARLEYGPELSELPEDCLDRLSWLVLPGNVGAPGAAV